MSLGLSIRDLLGRLSEAEGEQLSGRFKEPVIRLGAASVSRDAPTDLVRLDGKTALTVGTVLFVWWSREKKGIEFIRLRQQDREAAKVTQTISPNEREALIRFLKGEVQPGECSLFAGVVDLHDKQVEQTEKGITALENELGALVRSERKLKELNNVLNVKNATFLELYQSLKQKHFEDAKNASADKAKEKVSGSKRSSQADSSQNKSLKRSKDDSTTSTSSKQTPIVIIPSSTSSLSLISIYNIKEFLELGKFELTEEKKKKASSRTFQTPLLISKTSRTDKKKKFKLEVCDDTSKLNPADWDRVVAVFVTGQAWQFKRWIVDGKPSENPPEIFSRIVPFHLGFQGETDHENLSKWRIHRLRINRETRHNDSVAAAEFWHTLSDFINRNYPGKFSI